MKINPVIKGHLRDAIWFTIGATVGAIVAERVTTYNYEKRMASEIDSVKRVYSRNFVTVEEAEVEEAPEEQPEKKSTPLVRKSEVSTRPPKDSLNKVEEEKEEESVETKDVGTLSDFAKEAKETERDDVYIMSEEEYTTTMQDQGYENMILEYNPEDGTLVDEYDELILDIVGTVGDALNHIGYNSGDPNIVYVRNHKHQMDYEVIRISKS
jgi:hypothetical protein|nr:MAG TPA: hypothetical protein [Caudoviricetes sp.]